MTGEPQMVTASARVSTPKAKADACILLWMAGGLAAPDTFDPKRYVPYEVGLEVKRMLSTFPAIDTVRRRDTNLRGSRKHRARDGSRHLDPLGRSARSREHSSFATPISLAY